MKGQIEGFPLAIALIGSLLLATFVIVSIENKLMDPLQIQGFSGFFLFQSS